MKAVSKRVIIVTYILFQWNENVMYDSDMKNDGTSWVKFERSELHQQE